MIFQKKIQFLCYFFILINLTSTHGQTISRREYIVKFAPLAVKQMQIHKIPASITLAQGILESNNGNSSTRGDATFLVLVSQRGT